VGAMRVGVRRRVLPGDGPVWGVPLRVWERDDERRWRLAMELRVFPERCGV